MHSCVIRRDEIVARDVGHFPSLAIILSNAPDENNNNRPQSTLVERDPLTFAKGAFHYAKQRSVGISRFSFSRNTTNFGRNIPTQISGPPLEVIPNISVGRN